MGKKLINFIFILSFAVYMILYVNSLIVTERNSLFFVVAILSLYCAFHEERK